MPSFSSEVKNEISRLTYHKPCCRIAEMAALLRMGATIAMGNEGGEDTAGLDFVTKNAAVARKVLQFLKELKIRAEVMVKRSRRLKKNNSYALHVVPSPKAHALLGHLGILPEKHDSTHAGNALLKRKCCRAAYLRGAFLGGGSVNRPEAACHLEMATEQHAFAQMLLSLLRHMGLPAGHTERKDAEVVYLKERDAILDFLEMIEAEKSAEAFEVARNVKEVRSQVNRIVNCETANLQRVVDTAGRQIAHIEGLRQTGLLDTLPEKLRQAAQARLAHPDASLSELAELLHVSRSGVNHRLRKLMGMGY